MFDDFPVDIRTYFDQLAGEVGSAVALLIPPVEQIPGQPFGFALEALADLANDLLATFKPASLLVKPHPISGTRWVDAIRRRLATISSVSVVDKHHYLPVEVVLSAFDVVAVCGLGSTALGNLHRIYGLPIYSRDALLRELYSADGAATTAVESWISDRAGPQEQI
jgi:hypothetical protein